jgi:hypothetical protein
MKTITQVAVVLGLVVSTFQINAQTIDYGMFANSRLFTSTDWAETSARLNGGSAALGTFSGGFSYDFSGKTRAQLFSDFSILGSSTLNGTIGTAGGFLSGRFAAASIPTSLAINTPLFALVTTGSDLTSGNFAYIGGSDALLSPTWLAPDPSSPTGSTIIDLQALNNKVWAGDAVFQNGGSVATAASSLAIIPEPSTYALMALGGLVLFFIARRRKAQV